VLATPRPESIGETQEVHLVDGVQNLDDGALDDLALQRGDTEIRRRQLCPPTN
jgi:hypothetical protein